MTVAQVLSAIENPSGGATYLYCSGTSQQLTIPTFLDQFGNVMAVTPALSWSTSSAPSGAPAPTFTTSGGVTTVTFKMAGSYMLTAHGTTMPGLSFVEVVAVSQALTGITLSPNTCSVIQGADQQFTAAAVDQFGQAMATQPTFAWSTSGGTITAAGRLTTPNAPGTVR